MPQRKEVRWSQLRVGILSLMSLILLGIVIFLITGQTGFFTAKMQLRTYCPDAGGLKTGAVVRLTGVDAGNVRQVRLSGLPDPDQAVEIDMEINRQYSPEIRGDSKAVIAAEGLLGERYMNISKGTTAASPIPDGGIVPFQETAEFSELVGGSRDLLDNLNVLTVRLNSVVGNIESGKGTVGRLISDDSLYRKLNDTVDGAQNLVSEISSGKGSIGRLIASDEFYNHANATVAKLEDAANRIDSEEGTLGKLLHDPALYLNAQQLVAKGNTLVDNINQGKGTLGKLVTDDELHRKLSSAVGNFDAVLDSMRKGEGSMGRLFQDPSLYNNLDSTSTEVRELLGDFRKNPKKFLTIQLKIF